MRIVVEKDVPSVGIIASMYGTGMPGTGSVIEYLEERLALRLMNDNLVGIESTLKLQQHYSIQHSAALTTLKIEAVSAKHWL